LLLALLENYALKEGINVERWWPKEADRRLIARVGELRLLKKRRQLQERGPDSPRKWNADDEPVNEKFELVSGGLDLVSHNILLRFSILSVNIITLVHWAHGKIADQSDDEQSGH
jgi:hypothetical protein